MDVRQRVGSRRLLPKALPWPANAARGIAVPLGFAVLLGLLAPASAVHANPDASSGALALLDRLETVWQARDLTGYLGLLHLPTAEDRESEREFASRHFAGEEVQLRIQRPRTVPPQVTKLKVPAEAFSAAEPRGRVEQWVLHLEQGPEGWFVSQRELLAQIDGLVHLSLDAAGFRAEGAVLHLEDFEIRFHHGTLFTSPASLGPTAMVFVGDATVTVSPTPPTEREQLRQFCGRPQLVEKIRSMFLRIHPADLHRVLEPAVFVPDPEGGRRAEAAQRIFREHSTRSFILDASLPRSPWWLLPSLNDASVTFQTARNGTLTFTISSSEPESISLFDRARRKQICLYPASGREASYDEDEGRSVDVLHHDLSVRFEPAQYRIEGEDVVHMRLNAASSTIRLRLEDGLAIRSIQSVEGGNHLFFRVRNQNSVMVSLGPLAGRVGETTLTVRYAGFHPPQPIEREVLQVGSPGGLSAGSGEPEELPIDEVLVYTNRTSWYPNPGTDDYATANLRFDVPQGYTVLAGGERTEVRTEAGRTVIQYRQSLPGKYITAAVGRLVDAGSRRAGTMELRGFAVGRLRSQAADTLSLAADMLSFYQDSFGPCPYPALNLVLIEGQTPGGHSPPGMVLLAQRPLLMRRSLRDDPANFTDVPGFFLAHELAHQWWGHGVAGQNYRERWLSEAFAQYAAALWARRTRGEAEFRDILDKMGRWAVMKTAEGPIHLGHRLGHIKGDPQIYRAVVYDKGAYVLHMLREIVGDAAFQTALHNFQERYRFQKAGTDDLRRALEEASGRDLSAYFRDWVFGTALPQLHWSHRAEPGPGGYRTVLDVKVDSLPGPVPLEVAVAHGSGRDLRTVMLEPGGGRFTVETSTEPRKVEINGNRGLLATAVRN
jgi:Peptidase family M1 domain